MRTIFNQSKAIALFALGAMFVTLPSFLEKPGGEGYEIYLNNKLVVQHFGAQSKTIDNIQLDPATVSGELTVKYFHCGRPGKDRNITIKNDQNKVLKAWHYGDATTANAGMLCKVKEIAGLQKFTKDSQLKLFYSSSEIPNGRLLASINVGATSTAKK